jgi:dolichol-phosphate mannosyltransferase
MGGKLINSVPAAGGEQADWLGEPISGLDGSAALVNLNGQATGLRPWLSVVIPTRNEARNVSVLLDRLCAVLEQDRTEIIFTDDSDDGTARALARQAASCPIPVRLLHRAPGARKGGLSSAVLAGARHANGDWILVMDADLQHPPETVAVLASTARRYDCDLVVGTRFAGGGSHADGLNGSRRVFVSAATTRLVKILFPHRLAMLTDPLSGFFAFRKSAVNLDKLRPVGYKLLLEIAVRNPVARLAEVAYSFAPRNAGESKATLRQGITFLRHVIRLRRARLASQLRARPRSRAARVRELARFVAFGTIGVSGLGVNTAALWGMSTYLHWNHLLSASLATQVSTTWNFILVDSLIYRRKSQGSRVGRAAAFFVMNNLLLLARLPVLELLVLSGFGLLVANAITLILLFLVRFMVSDRAIFRPSGQEPRDPVRVLIDTSAPPGLDGPGGPTSAGRKRSRYLTYRYDIAGVVTIGSQILLPELEYFRAQQVTSEELDITVRVGEVGSRSLRRRAAMTRHPEPAVIRYEEHLGRIGANFCARFADDRIDIDVGPLLARSSHVVYTNVIEPLLRFVMVSRGYMLLHAACVEMDGTGIMLSALTDTGKTGTILRLIREHGCRFLSDDMTIIDAEGNAFGFPKPLTISAHTLRAVHADDLTRSEWRRLQIQSRLHSKSGRSIAMTLSRFNLPIMGINAITQIIIPPPKYTVDRLVPCHLAPSTKVSELFIIERGRPGLADLDHESALNQLIVNTDDAYGFPPFRHLAPAITIGGRDYRELREAERQILAGFLGHIRGRTLASDTFSWADDIPHLLNGGQLPVRELADHVPGQRVAEANGLVGSSAAHVNGDQWNGFAPVHASITASARLITPDLDVTAGQGGNGDGHLGSGVAILEAEPPPAAPVPARPGPRPASRVSPLLALLAVAAVAAPAAALRLWHINALGFNSDEAVYAGQAASIAGDPQLDKLFPVFRAHPLLFQLMTSLVYRIHVGDLAPRLLAVAFGLGTVAAGYALGKQVYGRRAGLITALLLAVMPYFVVVNRQALLDGPMAFFSVLALYLIAKFAADGRRWALYGAGAALGLAFISKETAAVLVPADYAFLALTPSVRVRLRELATFFGCFLAVALPYPVSLAVAGGGTSGKHFLTWQLFRPSNHVWYFYPTVVPSAIGIPVLVCAAGTLVLAGLSQKWSWRESLLLSWIIVPYLFFQLWPVKGFQYLLPVAAPCAVLAAGLLGDSALAERLGRGRARAGAGISATATVAVAAWLAVLSWTSISQASSASFLAGTGGVPGGREAGAWIRKHTPIDTEMLAIGPSMANILEFYGHRQVLGLSVSPNPLHRNPAYTPVSNPDLLLRSGQVQYIVWDSYSAARTAFFTRRLMTYVRRYRGSEVYVGSVSVRTPIGPVLRPVIIIYEVRP